MEYVRVWGTRKEEVEGGRMGNVLLVLMGRSRSDLPRREGSMQRRATDMAGAQATMANGENRKARKSEKGDEMRQEI